MAAFLLQRWPRQDLLPIEPFAPSDCEGNQPHLYSFFDVIPHLADSIIFFQCEPYHVGNNCVLMGDAVHAMVPFYGQGMNCVSDNYSLECLHSGAIHVYCLETSYHWADFCFFPLFLFHRALRTVFCLTSSWINSTMTSVSVKQGLYK